MRVLIVSDSHGRNTHLERVLRIAAPFDMFIHLGDLEGSQQFIEENVTCPVEMVSGNNDFFSDLDRDKCIMIGCYRVLLTHGHRYRVHHGTEEIKAWARANGADIVMFGHTHKPSTFLYVCKITVLFLLRRSGIISLPLLPTNPPIMVTVPFVKE